MARKSSCDRTIQFTNNSLDNLPCPEKGFVSYKDKKCPYLSIYITSNGARTFFVQKRIRGRTRRIIIGPYLVFSIEQARNEALKLCGIIASGRDPQAEKLKERSDNLTFGEHFQEYLERYAKIRKKSWRYDETEIKFHLSHWFNRRLSDITKSDIQKLHEKLGVESGFYQANTIIKRLSAIFNKAIEWGWIGVNPAMGIQKFKEQSRDRFIQPTEMKYILKALEEEPFETFRDYFKILLLTGVRKTNALMMRWEEINWDRGEWRIPETKNGDPLLIPIVKPAMDILIRRKGNKIGPWVFPQQENSAKHIFTPRKSWENILARATLLYWKEDEKNATWVETEYNKLTSYLSEANKLRRILVIANKKQKEIPPTFIDIRIHDIRRTFGSYQALTGASLPIIGRSLGHKSMQSTQIYARLNLDPVRESVEKATQEMFK